MGRAKRFDKADSYQDNQGNWGTGKPRSRSVCRVVDSRWCNNCHCYITLPLLMIPTSVGFSQPNLLLTVSLCVL